MSEAKRSAAQPPPDLVAALTTMGSHMIERQIDLMRELMGCTDAAAFAAVTSRWTEKRIAEFMQDQARVMEAAAAQARQLTGRLTVN